MSKMWLKHHFRFQKAIISLLFITLVALLSGCFSRSTFGTPDPEYLKLLDNGPCWNGICPDQTSLQDALDILSTLHIADMTQIEYIDERSEVAVPFDEERFSPSYILLKHADQTVRKITLIDFDYRLTLSQIIDYFGEPTWVVAAAVCAGDYAYPLYGLDMWYNERGVTVSTGGRWGVQSPSTELIPEPRLPIYQIIYHAKNIDLEQWVQVSYPRPWLESPLIEVSENLYPWPGWENPFPSYIDTCV